MGINLNTMRQMHPNSLTANTIAEPTKVSVKQQILGYLNRFGALTLHDLHLYMGMPVNKFSGRLTDLKREGKIEEVGSRKIGSTDFTVYALVKPPVISNPGEQTKLF
jgi:hypothetical protein